MLEIKEGKLIFHYDAEEVWIEPWGPDALRVRATKEDTMPEENWALRDMAAVNSDIAYTDQGARIVNGKIRAEITKLGKIMIYHSDGRLLLEEYWRNRRDILDGKCSAIEVEAREFKPIVGGDYHLTMRFESVDAEEKIYGMGQYGTKWSYLTAFAVVTIIPVAMIFIFMQKYIVSGMTSGAVKG